MNPLREAMFRGAYECARVIDEYGQTCDARSTLYAWTIDRLGDDDGDFIGTAGSGGVYAYLADTVRELRGELWLRVEADELAALFSDALYWEVFGRREAERDRRLV